MRQKMMDHRVRADCIQCHKLMDPIGFALENFDGDRARGAREDEGTPVDASDELFDGTKVDGPAGLRTWLAGYSDQFVQVVAEKLLAYALGPRRRTSGHAARRDRLRGTPRAPTIGSRRWSSASFRASRSR